MQETKQGDLLKARFTVWLENVILRAKIDYLRRNKGEGWISLNNYEESRLKQDYSFNTEQNGFEFENERINCAIGKLSKQKQDILIKIYIKDMSAEEIAKESGVTVQHVYNQHSLSLKQLKVILRLEIEGNALHVIDMATDKKIVTHRLLKGKGKAQVDREIQVDKNYFNKAKEKYESSSVVVKFIERIELTKPRYLKEQARLLHKIEKQYEKDDIISAIVACSSENRFCFTEVLSELLIQVGERNLKDIAPKRTASRYRKLANYNLLTEADDGFI